MNEIITFLRSKLIFDINMYHWKCKTILILFQGKRRRKMKFLSVTIDWHGQRSCPHTFYRYRHITLKLHHYSFDMCGYLRRAQRARDFNYSLYNWTEVNGKNQATFWKTNEFGVDLSLIGPVETLRKWHWSTYD